MGEIRIPVLSGTISHIPQEIRAIHNMETVYRASLLVLTIMREDCTEGENCSICPYYVEFGCIIPSVRSVINNIKNNPIWREFYAFELEGEEEE